MLSLEERTELMRAYIDNILKDSPAHVIRYWASVGIASHLRHYTDAELIEDIREVAPELLESWKTGNAVSSGSSPA